jgi:hypothetical protein
VARSRLERSSRMGHHMGNDQWTEPRYRRRKHRPRWYLTDKPSSGAVSCSVQGAVGVDPETVLVCDGIEVQTGQAVINRSTIFRVDVEDFQTINTVYSRHMPDPNSPLRTSQRRPPRDLLISIDTMAIKTNA